LIEFRLRKYLKKFYASPNMTGNYSCREEKNEPNIQTKTVPIGGQQSLGDNDSKADCIGVGKIQYS